MRSMNAKVIFEMLKMTDKCVFFDKKTCTYAFLLYLCEKFRINSCEYFRCELFRIVQKLHTISLAQSKCFVSDCF